MDQRCAMASGWRPAPPRHVPGSAPRLLVLSGQAIYDKAYVNGQTEIVLTNDLNFDPNVELKTTDSWTAIAKVP